MAAMFFVVLSGLFYSHSWAASANPDLKLNGVDALTTLTSSTTLTATVQMDAGEQAGEDADWWIATETPMGWYYYGYPDGWYLGGDGMEDTRPAYQGALFSMTEPLEVLRISGLPVGSYVFYFGFDTTVNGEMDGSVLFDQVAFEVVEAGETGSYPVDDDTFDFAYGDTQAGERIIDAQYASSNLYVANTAGDGGGTLFGVNFADGRIKGYGLSLFGADKTFFIMYVRNNTDYGRNSFLDNGDGAITDNATSLMWAQDDNGTGLNWEEALAFVETQNTVDYLGYKDWRLPNAKELQSIVDYSRSPDTTGSAAIDPLFNATSVTNEAGEVDYPFYWTGTTHANGSEVSGGFGAYVAFGRAMGYMNGAWTDVHGAGAQRSDPKAGDPADYPTGHGPQGDAIRIYNYVRLVRDANL